MSRSYKKVSCCKDYNRGNNVPIDICAETIWTFRLEWHIKNCFVLMIFVITDF